MKSKEQDNYTPKELAASIAFEALYRALQDDDFASDDSKSYRSRVRKQIKKLLTRIGDEHDFDYVLPA